MKKGVSIDDSHHFSEGQRINESDIEAMCVGFMRTGKLFESCYGCSMGFYDLFHFSLTYDYFGKVNDLKCLFKTSRGIHEKRR